MDKIKNKDLTSILINILYVKLLIAIPRNIILIVGSAGWILSLYVTLLMVFIYLIIGRYYDFSRSVYDIENKFLRILIGCLTTALLVLSMLSVSKIYPETVKVILLKNTPIEVIFFILAVASVLGASMGIKALGTICSLFQPVAAGIMVLCLLFLIPHMNIKNIMPLLGNGAKELFINGLPVLSFFGDVILVFVLGSFTEEPQKAFKSGISAIIVMGALTTVTLLVYTLVYPYGISQNFILPIYQLVRLIQVGDFFGRFEAFFEFVWSISVLLYFSIYLYTISLVWKNTFSLKYHKPLIAPFMIIISIIVYSSGAYTDKVKNFSWYSLLLMGLWFAVTVGSIFIQKKELKR